MIAVFKMAVVAHQVLHHLQQVRERLHAIHQILRGDKAPAHRIQRLAHQRGRMVETRLERQLGIMQRLVSMPTSVPLGQPPKKLTTPPRLRSLIASCHTSGKPTASITTSAPRPPVNSCTGPTRIGAFVIQDQSRRRPCGGAVEL